MQNENVNPFEMFEINTSAENEIGMIAQYPVPNHENRGYMIQFVHSGDTNTHFRDYLRARMKPLSFRINQELVSDEEYEDLLIEVFAEKIIKSWKSKDENGNFVDGIYGQNFEILPVTKANIIACFKSARRLFKDIKKQSDNFASFKNQITEDAIKN
jgi:hypothetical protein